MKDTVVEIILTLLLIGAVVTYHSMIIYGRTNKELDEEFLFGYKLGDSFDELPTSLPNMEVFQGKNYISYSPYEDNDTWEHYVFDSKQGKINRFQQRSVSVESKIEAREAMEVLSRSISESFTKGKGLRSYKRSRNYVYNKEQGIIMEIRLECIFDEYTINIYHKKYSWFRNLWDSFCWTCIDYRRPGITIGRFFMGQ